MNSEEFRNLRIKKLSEILNWKNINTRTSELELGAYFINNISEIKICGIIIGAVVPKNREFDLNFYDSNVELITLDLEIEKDLNNENLDLRVTGNGLYFSNMLDETESEEYIKNYLEELEYGTKDVVFDMLKQYDCSYTDLPGEILADEGLIGFIGDSQELEYNNKNYFLRFNRGWDIKNLINDINELSEVVFFDNSCMIIDELLKYHYTPFEDTKDLSLEDVENIGHLINDIVKTDKVVPQLMEILGE